MVYVERSQEPLTKQDFLSDQMVKWCPGCGDYAVLAAVSNVLPRLGYKKESYVMVSGIGCSSRFPYYVDTYGFHSIHGRANPIATGVKIANPSLSVWVNSGDGDAMAIGGNHFIHVIRRNMDINMLVFNNQIYGLTKGQYSPTSPMGAVTKTSPAGTIEPPFNPGELVMGAQGTFFARVTDTNPKLMADVLYEAVKHDGCSVVEVLTNCVIFNDKAHAAITGKDVKDDAQLILEHGKPMLFGAARNKGIMLVDSKPKVVEIGVDGVTIDDILVHDANTPDVRIHHLLATLKLPDFPVAIGIIRRVAGVTYNSLLENQMNEARAKSPVKCVDDLLNSGDTWAVD
ncbi:MAG: 2-oxoacid:ferredoxin oxidoreductase subunit beta [Bacteroidales bacterium]|jgi:2-oxoglutarate ferredoxin oxidoreductase subunit beta|nr:2-oxoacid:ferredoxin oxidoreductase subunit beta [Bacteroidales bacterium]